MVINEETREVKMELGRSIVADFHSYFVGEGKILSHDNTLREATSATVPGLTAK